MSDNIFSIPGFNGLPYNPQMPFIPGLAQTKQTPNVQGPSHIDPNQKQGQGTSPYLMTPSWQFGLNYNQIAFSNAVQGIGAFMRSNNQRKDFNAYNRAQQNPLSQLPENPNTTDQSLYGMKQYKSGGNVKMAEGGTPNFDDYDNFDEDDFQDLKDELDKYFNEKGTGAPESEEKQQQAKVEEPEEDEKEEQDDNQPKSSSAMDLLLSQQNTGNDEEKDETPETQSDADIMDELAGKKEIPHPSVYAGKPTDNVEAFKKGIAQVENAGYNEGNKNSSAFGKYQFTAPTREGVREQFFKDISKNDFENAYKSDPKFQERVMDVYGSHLLQKYPDPHQAATAFFLGEGKSGMYNQRDYNPGHGNISVGKYLDTFDKGYKQRQGGHIGNKPEGMSLGFDRPYNFKMEEGGDPNQVRKPIPVTDPKDPRLKTYQDSLRGYNYSKDLYDKAGLNPENNNSYEDMGKNLRPWIPSDNEKGAPGVKTRPAGIAPFSDQWAPYYNKPVQPYVYQPPTPQRSQVQGPQQMTGRPNITPPTGGPGPIAGGPTAFSFTGRDDNGQQVSRYFNDVNSWRAATDQMGYTHRETTNNEKEAHATGYQFREGGEYNLTNDQIKQLKKQGYQIEVVK